MTLFLRQAWRIGQRLVSWRSLLQASFTRWSTTVARHQLLLRINHNIIIIIIIIVFILIFLIIMIINIIMG